MQSLNERSDILKMGPGGLSNPSMSSRFAKSSDALKRNANAGKHLADFVPAGWGKKKRSTSESKEDILSNYLDGNLSVEDALNSLLEVNDHEATN